MQDELAVYYNSKKLIEEYSASNACDFLQSCWLIPENEKLNIDTLERVIFVQGDSEEVYSSFERAFVAKITQPVFYHNYRRMINNSFAKCRITVLHIPSTEDYYESSAALLKILKKAIDGFHFVVFVTCEGLILGCSKYSADDEADILLTPILTEKIDWEELYYLFLLRNDNDEFIPYYREITDIVSFIPRCFYKKQEVDEKKDFYSEAFYLYCYGDDEVDDLTEYYSLYYEPIEDDTETLVIDNFVKEMHSLNENLSYIHSNKVNSLEMLFEAEKQHNSEQVTNTSINDNEEANNLMGESFVDDPIELLKIIKSKKGIK